MEHPVLLTDEERQIDEAFQKLLDTYIASNHRQKVDIIRRAFNFARAAHKGAHRRSGEAYILHPLAVAQIVSEEMGLGSTSICAALLHDVIEDTEYTREDIANLFGMKIANIVEGVTKVGSGLLPERASVQAETFKKILLTMSDDIRVVLVKIADRLHNMRTLAAMPLARQHKIVGETLVIFAPLADRLGLGRIKTELEDLSFQYEHPDDYAKIRQQLHQTAADRDTAFSNFTPAICHALDQMGVDYEIKARVKSPYSIWQKMQRKGIPFEEVYDLLATRIVFRPKQKENEIAEAYAIYAAITQIYKAHPSRFRDWLSTPKTNGYQALHNTFMSPEGRWIEVQIRSKRMDEVAEGGFAAHWKYKDKDTPHDENELDVWINSIKEILDDPQPDTLDLLDTIKLNLFVAELQVFTPKGEVITLPQGATALDFAFAIHSFVGTHGIGAKVNHHLVPLNHRLSNGDQIEILTAPTVMVKPEWADFVATGKARGKIAAQLRKMQREQETRGEELLRNFLRSNDFELTSSVTDKLLNITHQPNKETLFRTLAEGTLQLGEQEIQLLRGKRRRQSWQWRRFVPFLKNKASQPSAATTLTTPTNTDFLQQIDRNATLQLTEELVNHCHICPDCLPVCDDEVIGFINDDQLEIHRRNCPKAQHYKTNFGNDLLAAEWCPSAAHRDYNSLLLIEGIDGRGVLRDLADVFDRSSNLHLVDITLHSSNGIFRGNLCVRVNRLAQLTQLLQSLQAIESIQRAVRQA